MGYYTCRADSERVIRETMKWLASDCNPANRPTMPTGYSRISPKGVGSTWLTAWRRWEAFMASIEAGLPVAQWDIFKHGNGKLPFWAFSTIPAFTCPGAGECLKWCYSFKAWRYPHALYRQLQNFVLLSTPEGRALMAQAFDALPAGQDLRLYVDGDFDTLDTMGFWFELLVQRPEIPSYGYSKSWPLFLEWNRRGRSFPDNYVLNTSSGSRYNDAMLAQVRALPVWRGDFIALPTDEPMPDITEKPREFQAWAAKLRIVAKAHGLAKAWVCPGKCGNCTPTGHACGSRKFQNIPVVIDLN